MTLRPSLFTILLISLVIMPQAAVASYPAAPAAQELTRFGPLTPAEAGEAAEGRLHSEMEVLPAWNGADIGDPILLYDLDGQVAAYLFPVLNGGQDAGYITVSAEQRPNPVLEFSTSPARVRSSGTKVADFARSHGLSIDLSRPLYLGPLAYFYQVEGSQPVKLINLSDLSLVDLPQGPRESTAAPTPEPLPVDPSIGGTVSQSDMSAGRVVKILNGPDYTWYMGCAPTAAGNLMGYWSDRGYPNLVDGGSQGDFSTTIVDLADLMDTNYYGWTFFPINTDLVAFAKRRGYKGFHSDEWMWPPYSMLKGEIDHGRPAVLLLGGSWQYGSHFVTLFGYDYDPNNAYDQYMVIHDTYDHGDYRIAFGWGYSELDIDTLVPPSVFIDTFPPETRVLSLPRYQTNTTFQVNWSGSDRGWGIKEYDIQVRDLSNGTWTDWVNNTLQTSAQFTGKLGHTYEFRSRGTDIDGNHETYPAQADAVTSLVSFTASGQVLGNRGKVVPNALVEADPPALAPAVSGAMGSYQLGFISSGAYTLTVAAGSNFGAWLPMRNVSIPANYFENSSGSTSGDTPNLNLFLPPPVDLITNGNFENNLLGWSLGPAGSPALTENAYNGASAMAFDAGEVYTITDSVIISQSVSISPDLELPTLSFLYRPATPSSGSFSVQVQGLTATLTSTLFLDHSTWQHAWLDLDPIGPGRVEVRFTLQGPARTDAPVVYLDAVTLGPGHLGPKFVWLPMLPIH